MGTIWKNHLTREASLRYVENISAIVLLMSVCSFAGIDLRVGGGLNLSNEIHSGDFKLTDSYTKKMHAGFNVGANMAVYFTQQLGVVAGLGYETRGSGWKYETADNSSSLSADFSMNYIQIPALFSYKPIPSLAINLGPELGIFLNGKSTIGGETTDLDEIKPIDLGVSLNVDYIIMNMIAVGAGYYYGFLNNDDRPRGDFVKGGITNHNIKLYVAYVFHLME